MLGVLCLLCLVALHGDAPAADPLRVTVTAYASGTVTTSGKRPRPGMIALSRDVERALRVHFGDLVHLSGLGPYRFEDRMPWYWHRRVDVYLASRQAARQFGKQSHRLVRVSEELQQVQKALYRLQLN